MEQHSFEEDILRSLEVLKAGGTILYPTDTVWGIGCDATNPEAVKKVMEIKNRPESKAFVVLLADERDLIRYLAHLDLQVFDFLAGRPKPTTVIYEGPIGFAENLVAEDHTVAIRLVKEDFCRHLIKRFRKPIVSTSANISGEPAPAIFSEINDSIKSGVDYIVRYRQDDDLRAEPSSIIKWKNNEEFEVIRP
ncbi:MAG: L-threonylcarbamoyladenylate synthase [Flavitalea sp.]